MALFTHLLGFLPGCADAVVVEVPLSELHNTPVVELVVDGQARPFILDTGTLSMVLNPSWASALPVDRRTQQLEGRMWGHHYAAWALDSVEIQLAAGHAKGEVKRERALLSPEQDWTPATGDPAGFGGILGGLALGSVAKEVRYTRRGELSITEGACHAWPQGSLPFPSVRAEVEGERLLLLVDTGALWTRLFADRRSTASEISVRGIPEPLHGRITKTELVDEIFASTTLGGTAFDGVIGWRDLQRFAWRWIPCTGQVIFDDHFAAAGASG